MGFKWGPHMGRPHGPHVEPVAKSCWDPIGLPMWQPMWAPRGTHMDVLAGMIASDTQFDYRGGFSGLSYPMKI